MISKSLYSMFTKNNKKEPFINNDILEKLKNYMNKSVKIMIS